ncbi:MAG TPA: hypothetical protein VFZ74_16100 [Burkholderiales bacterium]
MDRFPVEIIYVLVFLGFVLFNVLTQMARRRQQSEAQAGERDAADEPPSPAADEPLEDIWGRVPPPAPVTVPPPVAAPHAAPALPRRVHPVRALLKDKRDLRRAVILMMVLGPCRSQEPPEGR